MSEVDWLKKLSAAEAEIAGLKQRLNQVQEIVNTVTQETGLFIVALDADLRYTFFNQAYQEEIKRLTGKDISIGMHIMEVYSHMPEQQKIAVEEWSEALQGIHTSKTIKFGDPGRYQKVYNLRRSPIRDASGSIVGVGEIASDVTEKAAADGALLESEMRYHALFNSMTEGFGLHEIICDDAGRPVDYRFLDVNPAFERLTGLKRADVIGKSHNELMPDDSPAWAEQYGRVALTGEPVRFTNYSPALRRYYETFAYCPAPGQFAVIFTDITERQRSDETRNWLATFPELNPLPVVEVDLSGNIYYQNPAARQLFSGLPGAVELSHWLNGSESVFEKFKQENVSPFSRNVSIGSAWYKQTWYPVPGTQRVRIYSAEITDRVEAEAALRELNARLEETVEVRTQELHRANDNLLQDVSRRTRVEEALKAEQQRFIEVLEMLPAYLILLTPDYHVSFANRYFREHFGESYGRPCYEYLFGRSQPCEICETYKTLMLNRPLHWEWTGPDQRIYDVHDFPFTDVDGSSLILEMGIDITERKQAEAALNQSVKRNQILAETAQAMTEVGLDEQRILDTVARKSVEAIGDGCVIRLVSPDGQWLEAAAFYHPRPEMLELLKEAFTSYRQTIAEGLTGEVYQKGRGVLISGKDNIHLENLIPPQFLPRLQNQTIESVLSVPLHFAGEVIGTVSLYREGGHNCYTEDDQSLLQAMADRLGLAIQKARLYRDLAQALDHELNMHDQLVQAEKFAAMGRMLASITHELNNPLQTIKNCLYLSQQDLPSNSSVNEFLGMAASETERIANLVDQLREMFRPRQNGQRGQLSLFKVLDEVKTLVSVQLEDKHVKWVQGPAPVADPSGLLINGSSDQIKQVFINISINAIEAMQHTGGQLMVDIVPGENDCEVGVRFKDTGPGIAADDLARMFEPFFTTKGKGLGLGLAICYDIVRLHGGRIAVESTPGQGATFIVWLPLAEC